MRFGCSEFDHSEGVACLVATARGSAYDNLKKERTGDLVLLRA